MPLPEPTGKGAPELGIFVVEPAGLSVPASPGGCEPEQDVAPLTHTTTREPTFELLPGPRQRFMMTNAAVRFPRQSAKQTVSVDFEFFPAKAEGIVLDPREHVIENDVPARRGAGVEALEQLAPDEVPRTSDLPVEPSLGGAQPVMEHRPSTSATNERDVVMVSCGLDPAKHGSFGRAVFPKRMATETTAPTGSTALDDRTCQIFRGHHYFSSVQGPRALVLGSLRNRSSGVLFNARLSAR